MSFMRRALEWYLGLPAPEAGQQTQWRLEFHWPEVPWFVPAALGLAALTCAAVVIIYWRDAAQTSRRVRTGLAALRLTVLVLAALCLLQTTVSVGRIGLPTVAILIDDSASMGLEDHYQSDETNALVDRLVREGVSTSKTRLTLTQDVLTRHDGEFLKQLLRHHTLRLYRFSDTAVQIGSHDFRSPDEVPAMLELIGKLRAEGNRTRPAPSLRKVLGDFRGTPPAAVVVFSDGVASTGSADRLSLAAEGAAADFVPLYTVGVGSEQPTHDVQLYDVSGEELAFVGDPYTVSGKIKADGFPLGKMIGVRLLERESGRVLGQTLVAMRPGNEPVPFEISFVPNAPGEIDATIEVPALPEESNADNNRETRHISIRSEKLRVLLVDSSPRWEFRYLKTLFERDPTVRLKTVLQEADTDFASEDETALPHFPLNRQELFQYDVIVLGDVNPALLGSPSMGMIRDFVRESGGGLLMIAGGGFNPAEYRGTPLEELVPLDLSEMQPAADDSLTSRGFHPELTVDGLRGSSVFRFGESEGATLEVWKSLPELYWICGAAPPKPTARVFVSWQRRASEKPIPVISLQPVGAGKVLFHATDELWRWRFRTGDRYVGPFWGREIRYLSRSRLIGRDRTAELTSDRREYSQGEPATLRLRFFDERFVPASTAVQLILERRNGERRTLSLTRVPGQPTVFEGQAAQLAVGSFHAFVTQPSFKEAPPATEFRVDAGTDELVRRNLDRTEMQRAAELSRGAYCGLDGALDVPRSIPRGHPVALSARDQLPLWNRWEVLFLFAGVLTAEWILRKRARLL